MRPLRRLFAAATAVLVALVVGPYLLPLPAGADEDAARLAGPDGTFLDLDGTRIHVERSGPEGGPAVVLLHGFGGSTYQWRFTRRLLADAGHRVVAIDLRGFGLSEKSFAADHGHAAQARVVLAAMDAIGIASAVLVGHSMGANVAGHVAFAAPARVRALVLVDAALVTPGVAGGWERAGAAGGAVPAGTLLAIPQVRRTVRFVLRTVFARTAAFERILRSAYADPSFPTAADVAAYGAALRLPDWDLALLAIVRDAGLNELPRPLAELGRTPVLVAWGGRDPWIPLATGEAVRDAIPGAAWLLVPDAGHLPMEEGRAAFEPALLAFLEDLP